MKVAVLTSKETRHRYFVQALRGAADVVAVVYEDTGYSPEETVASDLSPGDRQIVADHFAERSRQELHFFGSNCDFVDDGRSCRVERIGPGTLNSTDTLGFLQSAGAEVVVVYGTSLIKKPLLTLWSGRMVNMHLGLSPYYRGTATNFYPLLNDEPEYVGATIHLIDEGIDSGPILAQARPEITAEDMPHTIGCKAILAGIDTLMAVLSTLEKGHVEPVPQWRVPNARLYLRKHYHQRQVVELYRKIDEGLMRRYVARAPQAAQRVRLVSLRQA